MAHLCCEWWLAGWTPADILTAFGRRPDGTNWSGRFPRARAEFGAEVVAFVARQMHVPASELGFYEWSGRTIEYHRAQIRDHLGFRVCGVVLTDG